MKKTLSVLCVGIAAAFMLVSCSNKGAVDTNRPVEEVAAEAKTMSIAELKNAAANFQKAIESKKVDLEKVQARLKEIPMTQLLGEEAKKIKDDLSKITSAINDLSQRMNVYVQELTAKGGSL